MRCRPPIRDILCLGGLSLLALLQQLELIINNIIRISNELPELPVLWL